MCLLIRGIPGITNFTTTLQPLFSHLNLLVPANALFLNAFLVMSLRGDSFINVALMASSFDVSPARRSPIPSNRSMTVFVVDILAALPWPNESFA
ncbi:hypothetical protein KI387_044096 [Taxus chinensis]|uniref:Uncharacterized protein n=1 Tax=Taxus chinensis TaxID=29808 RepID=A0AA38FEP9_TAXCH|nr:hypothetical protein KI387_044096 [Taxus chinensis]